jgi:transketolase
MNQACRRIRAEILQASYSSRNGHIPTCFSVIESLYAVYSIMQHDPAKPDWIDRDLFVLSKGHASLGHYAVLAEFGYFDIKELNRFGAFESSFGCHADRTKVPGIEASTGSLGHGIGLAVGMALAIRIAAQNRRVFTLIGDGESNEGSVWEAIMVAVNLKLTNLTIIYDHNKSQGRCLPIANPADRFRAFGCDVVETNGHDIEELKRAMSATPIAPRVVIANTQKGYGCNTLVKNVYEWHRRSPNENELPALMEELNAAAI